MLGTALAVAQTALTTFCVLCGLLLLPFVEPPTAAWTGGDVVSGDWRPTLLAVALLAAFGVTVSVPALRDVFELAPLSAAAYGLIGLVVVVWALVQRLTWRARLLDRFLNVDLG